MTTGHRLFRKTFLRFSTMPRRHMPLLVHFESCTQDVGVPSSRLAGQDDLLSIIVFIIVIMFIIVVIIIVVIIRIIIIVIVMVIMLYTCIPVASGLRSRFGRLGESTSRPTPGPSRATNRLQTYISSIYKMNKRCIT